MMKRLLVLLAVLCTWLLPALSQAAAWKLTAKVMATGGGISVRGATPITFASGSVQYNYTTSSNNPNKVGVSVAPLSACYAIQKVVYNSTTVTAPASPWTRSFTPADGTAQTLYGYFVASTLNVTASVSGNGGGIVSPSSGYSFTCGSQPSSNIVYNFVPNTGNSVTSISGVPAGAVQTGNFGVINGTVTITISKAVAATLTGNVSMVGTFSGVKASVGYSQVAQPGQLVNLSGSAVPAAGATFSWTPSVSNPAAVTLVNPTSATPSFTAPSVLGTYYFTLSVNNGAAQASTSVMVTDSLVRAAATLCADCHKQSGLSTTMFQNWSTANHSRSTQSFCTSCHLGTADGDHPGSLVHATVNETTFTYTSGGNFFCLNGTCHNPGITHKTLGMACATCHRSGEIHNPNASFADATNVCFSCHGGVNTIHYYGLSIPTSACVGCHNPSGHNPAPSSKVPLAHFNGYTSYVNPSYAAAYVTPVTQCGNCHKGGDPSSADDQAILQYRTDWAASGHGDTKGAPWVNSASHNWKASGQAGVKVSQAGAPTDCQRCHTATGYVLFSNLSSIAPIATTAARYSEPLTCNACHNSDFTLRSVTPRTGYYNYTSANTGRLLVSASLPDSQTSNICLGCHVGREAGDTIKAMAAATAHGNYSTAFWKNVSFLNSHYLTAGGQVFGTTGYEYPGNRYSNAVDHSQVGAGVFGPCVTCHMPGNSHTLDPATASYSQCNSACHGGAMNSTFVASRTADFNAALQALGNALTQKGYAPNLVGGVLTYPYFSAKNWGNKDTGPATMGADFNYNLLVHDPGAFAHNPTYTKRLVRDSLDYLTNGSVDRSRDLTATVNALLTNSTDRADASAFLLDAANGSSACAVCHSSSVDLAGNAIVATYNASLHSTVPGGAACGDCHAPGATLAHPPSMTMLTDPAAIATKCFGCHGVPANHSWPALGLCANCHNGHNPAQVHVGYPHFSSYSTAQYVTSNFSCNNCHFQAGNPSFHIYSANFQWSKSGHGNPVGTGYVGPGPYTEANLEAYDFKFLGTPAPASAGTTVSQDCVRCHTATGYASYVTPTDPNNPKTAFSNISPWGVPGDRTREMVACPACHNPTPFDAGYSRRTVGILDDSNGDASSYTNVVEAWYNYSSATTKKILRKKLFVNPAFAEMTDSNICITCHAGRATGDLIRQSTSCASLPSIACRVGNGNATTGLTGSFWANVNFVDPHGGVAANLMFPDSNRAGYEYRAAAATPYHTNIGLDSTQGPCVGCHMSSPVKHSFTVLSSASNGVIGSVRSTVCTDCHGPTGTNQAFDITAAALEAKRSGYKASLAVIQGQLAGLGIYYNPALPPYFFTTGSAALQSNATRVVNWNYNSTFQGANLMGAAFNLRLLDSDTGWAHNGTYSKRLLYDTIDYLNDGKLDNLTGLASGTPAYNYLVPRP